jgi:hypothetical protein
LQDLLVKLTTMRLQIPAEKRTHSAAAQVSTTESKALQLQRACVLRIRFKAMCL